MFGQTCDIASVPFSYSYSCLLIKPICRLSAGSKRDNAVSIWSCVLQSPAVWQNLVTSTRVSIMICLARSSIAQPAITRDNSVRLDSGAMPVTLPFLHRLYSLWCASRTFVSFPSAVGRLSVHLPYSFFLWVGEKQWSVGLTLLFDTDDGSL